MSADVVSYDDSSSQFVFDPPVTCVDPAVWCPNACGWLAGAASLIVAGIKRTRKSGYFKNTAHTAFCGNCSVSLSWTGGSSVAVSADSANTPRCVFFPRPGIAIPALGRRKAICAYALVETASGRM